VPPEYLVFRIFYVNEMNTSKPKKKKKKAAEECDAKSDSEEIDNPLDSADLSLEAGTRYYRDDSEQAVNEDDDGLGL
jgi:ribosome biogenesis protein MAK21